MTSSLMKGGSPRGYLVHVLVFQFCCFASLSYAGRAELATPPDP